MEVGEKRFLESRQCTVGCLITSGDRGVNNERYWKREGDREWLAIEEKSELPRQAGYSVRVGETPSRPYADQFNVP